ncbi:tRNA (adenosine(37)-N6)-threonylcarbamoyltransferase complex dimerization subunit type 1 TsaB [Pontibacter sp. JH31]|uniref:tRNA (Adenosine(37)-N6)-threonylcarbamoyltransferase complex dimerization subunit type 1 TsaB n=1 Tax=Pontibacter aquaedesilientis TaxID=2766980 RepID=A0ABR7XJP0_9BACT|nr:tRNA (adenosine(37)-N6)-threonylcarbamoyltransferase complex dimerization subunit type 1 TsaB [Pontibacter aquaedesilientis]MBD1398507.1 tRNA (adenosine(37)-N6)-threonylcarbamoyltransferase complex dimerization subunit type 1 TsaB [Pontibacter aquaedesilientis]
MPILLALETSSTVCSVALYNGADLLGASELQIEKSHSSHITVMISQLIENCGLELKQLSAVAVSGGPGSYTGLRIGSSTAKGLCYSLDIPLLEVSTLYGLALQAISSLPNPQNYLFCPMIDARRMEVYTCLLNYKLEEQWPITPVILDEHTFNEQLEKQPIVFFGNGTSKFRKLKEGNVNALFIDDIQPSAKPIGQLALTKYEQQAFEDIAYYEPFYLKDVYITSASKNII